MPRLRFLLLCLLAVSIGELARAADDAEFFERRVRPILAANCFSCHGDKKQESNLRLDSRDAVLKGGDGGAIVGDKPMDSRMLEAIRWDGDLKMPPETKLRDEEIAILSKWVELGVPWPATHQSQVGSESWRAHWAFQPVQTQGLPMIARPERATTAIDYFILAELDKHQLSLSQPADRRTLIRRATFDLHGLPPTPAEIDVFLADQSANAYEKLVDRLLASPRYGERWGRHWLDLARYADTKGYVFFEDKKYPWAYTYRDYVIGALNDDKPYDRFLLEQLAADQLEPQSDSRQLAALGFLTVGSHFMNNTHDIIDDRIDVVTRGLMGLTVTCSRCHDHKYDPISAGDYYALYGVFRSCYEPTVPPLFEAPPDTEQYRKFAAEMAAREKKLTDFITQKHAELVSSARTRAGEYLWAAHQLRDQPPTDDFMLLVDKGDLNPTMILRWQVYLSSRPEHDPIWKVWQALAELPDNAFASPRNTPEPGATQRLAEATIHSLRPMNAILDEALTCRPLTSMQDVAHRFGQALVSIDDRWQGELRTARARTEAPPERLSDPAAEELRQVIYGVNCPPDVPLALDWGFLSLFPDRPTQAEYEKLLKEVEQWMMTGAGAPARSMVLLDDPRPFQPRIFLRGNPNRLGESVPRRFLSLFDNPKAFEKGSGRLELAQAIASPSNPLTARVAANRLWTHHFGSGLVRTVSDFGLRSEPPSHPELLDWLATELVSNNWSLKHLHRLILTSAVYRQASTSPAEKQSPAGEVDPENRLLSFFPRRRLEFEAMRDAMFSVADQLESKIGGPPSELLADKLVPRRTIYGTLDRMDVPTLLTTFDFPNPLTSSSVRTTTTVAPQSLYVMNSTVVSDLSQKIVARPDIASVAVPQQKVSRLFQLCFGREATTAEVRTALELFGPDPSIIQWERLAHALLLSNEFVFVD